MGLLAFLVDAGIDGMNGFKFSTVRRAIVDKGGWSGGWGGAMQHVHVQRVLLPWLLCVFFGRVACASVVTCAAAVAAVLGCWPVVGLLAYASASSCTPQWPRSPCPTGGFMAPYLTHVGISLAFALVAGGLVRWVQV